MLGLFDRTKTVCLTWNLTGSEQANVEHTSHILWLLMDARTTILEDSYDGNAWSC